MSQVYVINDIIFEILGSMLKAKHLRTTSLMTTVDAELSNLLTNLPGTKVIFFTRLCL